jgi:hypothetical protein
VGIGRHEGRVCTVIHRALFPRLPVSVHPWVRAFAQIQLDSIQS